MAFFKLHKEEPNETDLDDLPHGMEPSVSYVSGRIAGAAKFTIAWEGVRQAIFATEPSTEVRQILRQLGVRYSPAAAELVQQLAVQMIEDSLDKITLVVHHDQQQQG